MVDCRIYVHICKSFYSEAAWLVQEGGKKCGTVIPLLLACLAKLLYGVWEGRVFALGRFFFRLFPFHHVLIIFLPFFFL